MWCSSAAQHHSVTLAIAPTPATLPGKFQNLKNPQGSSYNGNPALCEFHLSGNTFRYPVLRLLMRICCNRVIHLVLHYLGGARSLSEVRCAQLHFSPPFQ